MIKMSNISFDKPSVSKLWIALKRLDKNDDRVVALREVSVPPAAEVTMIIQIITTTFGLNSSGVIFKIRNHRGCLIPLNSLIPANSKHMPYVLEVAKIFQHVRPKPRTIPMINKNMKTKPQAIGRRCQRGEDLMQKNTTDDNTKTNFPQIQRLEELLPQIKLRRDKKLSEEIECLNQKLRFLHNRMQVADSRSWKGVLTRAPLW